MMLLVEVVIACGFLAACFLVALFVAMVWCEDVRPLVRSVRDRYRDAA